MDHPERAQPVLDHRAIAGRFNAGPGRTAATLLVGGAEEPLYLPERGRQPAIIRYTRDYAQSALHEIAHWCLAGRQRRRVVDYGLWYQPPPRSVADQARFYHAEVPVQALEMLLSEACGRAFHFSADNPGADGGPARRAFEARVRERWLELHEQARTGTLCPDIMTVLAALNPRRMGHPPQSDRAAGTARAV